MRSPILKLSIITFFLSAVISCQIKKEIVKSNQEDKVKTETVRLNFEILTNKISLDEIKKIKDFRKKLKTYQELEILATLKQINTITEIIALDNFIIYENFEITNTTRERKDDLITSYDYTPIFDPETYEVYETRETKPNEYFIDTINLVNDFRFYLSDADTLLIRIKKQYFEKEIYSNWDTLIIK